MILIILRLLINQNLVYTKHLIWLSKMQLEQKLSFFLHSDDTLKCCKLLIEDTNHCTADFYGVEIKGKFFKRKWHIKKFE